MATSRRDGVNHWHHAVTNHYALVLPIVHVLTRHAPPHVDRDELHAAGLLGLVDAAKRFTPNGDVPFAAYASVRIRGAIIDAMRRDDWAPRRVRTQIRHVRNAADHLHAALQRTPTQAEIAAYLGVTASQTHAVVNDQRRAQMASLAASDHGSYETAYAPWQNPTATPEEHMIVNEQHADVAAAIGCLPQELQQILMLRFIHEWSLSAIGNSLQVSDARVAQLVKEGVNILWAVLSEQRDDVPKVAADAPGSLRRARVVKASVALRLAPRGRGTIYP